MTVHRNEFLFNKTNRRTNFQIYSGTQHVELCTRINLEISASVGFIEKKLILSKRIRSSALLITRSSTVENSG